MSTQLGCCVYVSVSAFQQLFHDINQTNSNFASSGHELSTVDSEQVIHPISTDALASADSMVLGRAYRPPNGNTTNRADHPHSATKVSFAPVIEQQKTCAAACYEDQSSTTTMVPGSAVQRLDGTSTVVPVAGNSCAFSTASLQQQRVVGGASAAALPVSQSTSVALLDVSSQPPAQPVHCTAQLPTTSVDTPDSTTNDDAEPVVRHRPQVPPKPQIDIVRYSMANAKDDLDLDTILNELLELENQLSSDAADQMLVGITPLVQSTSVHSQLGFPTTNTAVKTSQPTAAPFHQPSVHFSGHTHVAYVPSTNSEVCASPDADSAYGDSSSTECSSGCARRNRNSEISSADSYRGSLNTPSPTNQASPKSASSDSGTNGLESCSSSQNALFNKTPMTDAEIKAAKIREALEKMKEAKMKKIYVKFFLEDDSTKGMLIDERWTVAETMQHLADKLHILLTPEHAIVEEYPELHIKRIYEDHEFVVENIEDWLAESKNKLYFIRRMDKYCFIHSPQHYLITEKSDFDGPSPDAEWTAEQKSDLSTLKTKNLVPELEGWLMLKADGKKSWKKHYFVLRSSGLYYCPKGKMRGTKDLQCLMNVYNNQVYTCTDWRKKYKAPSNFGFAIKHPKIQVKTSKYIKYICTEDEKTFRKWIAALRITKNGSACLDQNFRQTFSSMQKASLVKPIHVDVHQRIPTSEKSSAANSRPESVAAQSQNGISRVSLISHSRHNNIEAPLTNRSHASPNTAFDRDDCGTIKRQPDPLSASSTTTFNSSVLNYRGSSQSPALPPTPTRSSVHSASSRLAEPTSCTVETYEVNTAYPTAVNLATDGADSDSDEEQFPPPPEVVYHNQSSNYSTQQFHRNGISSHNNSTSVVNHRPVVELPQTITQVNFRPGMQPPPKPAFLTPKPVVNGNQTPLGLPPLSNGNTPNRPPSRAPPPPTRSSNTRIQSPALMNEQHKQQMDFFNELQQKLQQNSRQNHEIHGN
ncbi:hypothetical protein M3Y94_00357800 [Aphelenchoides besseyi]|nr:hypothetical protein M3Y94_00357800 [Aphelenchoides besseyi]